MATDLGRAKSTAANKYDAFVAEQLTRATSRIRLLDLTAGLLGFAVLSLAYVVGMVLCDSKLILSQHTRQLALYVFLSGGAFYLFFVILRPLRLRVNPYYAARQIEQLLPQAKNSIVNWVDLHEQQLPPAIRGALGQRAAKDLTRADLDRAISGRRAAWMGGLAGMFTLAFLALFFLLGPAPFLSLLKRTFDPFGSGGVSTRTQLTIRKPEGGNAAITVGRGLNFVVEVNGKVPDPKSPDAVKLRYRYEEGDPWLERPLIQEPSREWTTSLSAIEVRNGFWYKITGGDAATEEYRVAVRAAPAITDFLARYHFRPYVARADEAHRERELKALRGTEVLLRVRTNRALRDGRLEFVGKDGPKTVRGETDPNDARTLFVKFVIEEDGKYRLYFTSTESEAYSDPVAYPVTAIPDQPPVVELTKPGQDIHLPADALLHLEGKASDDIGVKALTLRMRVIGGDKLRAQPYRGEDALRLGDGGYPREVEYEDFVDLSRVQSEDGQPVALKAGMELEYWLEASDACDYPHANLAESKHYRVRLIEPEKNEPKHQQAKRQAAKDQKQHEQKQDQKLQQENKERQQARQEQETRNHEEENKSKDADKGGEQANNGGNKDNDGQKDESKDGSGERNNGEEKSNSANEDQKIEEQIKKALEKKEASEDAKSEEKPDKGEGKGAQANKSEDNGAADDKSKGESKDAGTQGAKESGEGKDKGQPQADADSSQSDGKGDNQASPMSGDKNERKDGNATKQNGAGESTEGKGKPDAAPKLGEGKPSGDPQASKDAAQDKPQPMGQGREGAAGENKPTGGKEQQAERKPAAEAKDRGDANRGEAKDKGERKDDGKAETKASDSSAKGEPSAGGDRDGGKKTAKSESKPDPDAQARNATPKDIQDLARGLNSKDAQEREKAKRQLERIEKRAADAEAREKAGETLEKFGEPDGSNENRNPANGNTPAADSKNEGKEGESPNSSSSVKGGEKPTDSGEKNGRGTPVEPKNEGKVGEGAQGGTSSDSEKNDKNGAAGEQNSQTKKKDQSSSPHGKAQGSEVSSDGGSQAGGGGERRNGQRDASGGDEGLAPESKPAQPHPHRAAQMQLEEFAKKVNKDILKEAGVSEEAWKKYLESKRKQLTPREKPRPDTPSAPQQANQLPSMGGKTIQPSDSGQGDAHGPDRGQPPPGYRDPFREFTRQMSKKN